MTNEDLNRLFRDIFNIDYVGMKQRLIDQYAIEKNQKDDAKETLDDDFSKLNILDTIYDVLKTTPRESNDNLLLTRWRPKHIGQDLLDSIAVVHQYAPETDFSLYYNILFVAVLILGIFEQPEKAEEFIICGVNLPLYLRFAVQTISNLVLHSVDMSEELANEEMYRNFYVSQVCEKIQKEDYSNRKQFKDCLVLFIQVGALFYCLTGDDCMSAIREISAKISLEFIKVFYRNDEYDNGIRFASIALSVRSVKDRHNAYNLLGLCAIDRKQYQFAYDVYFSWINRKNISSLKEFCNVENDVLMKNDEAFHSKDESSWRTKHKDQVALMYGNFTYVCGEMYNLLKPSEQREAILSLAKHYVVLAVTLDPIKNFLCSAGTVFSHTSDREKSIDYYKQYYQKAETIRDRVTALRSIISEYQRRINRRMPKEFEEFSKTYILCYQQLSDSDKKDAEEIAYGSDLFFLLNACDNLIADNKMIKYYLLKIDNTSRAILRCLRRSVAPMYNFNLHINRIKKTDKKLIFGSSSFEIKDGASEKQDSDLNISYYTTLNNLKYLFSEGSNESDETKANYLTMMHARYMNDPDEGLILFQSLEMDILSFGPELLRDTLYDQKYIFLKSFTGLIDQLNMWTMYGSDRQTGKDCNGCCVCLAQETFDTTSDLQNKSNTKSALHLNDDYDLFSVAYIDKNKQIIVNGERRQDLEKNYKELKRLLTELGKIMTGADPKDRDTIVNCLVRILEKPMFLFKDVSYSLEAESRMIISRGINERMEIHRTPQNPPKLYITPPLQVFPKKIILGPKVEDPDYWIPHLQYELSKIQEKWAYDEEYKPMVRTSRINIR